MRPGHPLHEALVDVQHEQLVECVPIAPFTEDGTAAMVATLLESGAVSTDLVAAVHAHAEGNAFFTHEVIHTLLERGEVRQTEGLWAFRTVGQLKVPETVRAVTLERVGRLSHVSQAVLQEASILGQTFTFQDLRAVGERGELEVDEALEEATALALVQEVDGEEFAFQHVLTRRAVYEELSERKRRRLHLAAAVALESRPERERERRAAELARHFQLACDPTRALPYLVVAGDGAEAVFAHAMAEQHYRRALELAQELGNQTREAEVREKVGRVFCTAARWDEALESLEKAVRIHRMCGDAEAEVRVTAQMGEAYRGKGMPEEGIARLRRVLETLETVGPSRAAVAAYIELGLLFRFLGRDAEALTAAERAAELARVVGDQAMLARAEVARGSALLNLDRLEECRSALEAAIPLVEAIDDARALGQAESNLGAAYCLMGELNRAFNHRERACDLAARMGDPTRLAFDLAMVGETLAIMGQWDAGRARLQEAVSMLPVEASSYALAFPPVFLGWLSLLQGDFEDAVRYAERGIAIAERGQNVHALRFAQCVLAQRDIWEGRPEEAVTRLEPLAAGEGGGLPFLLVPLAWGYLDGGHAVRAEQVLTDALDLLVAASDRLGLVEALPVKGMLLSQRREWDEAARVFEQAIALAERMPYPFAEACALYEYGMMCARRGDREQARARLEQALTIFRQLGAKKHVQWSEQRMVELV